MSAYLVESTKLIGYLLNVDHPKGSAKCALFLRFGFRIDASAELARALIDHAEANRETSQIVVEPRAVKRVVAGPITTPGGRTPNAVSVWEVMPDGRERLITAYIREA